MADSSLSNEYITALFELDGETMIGTFITSPNASNVGKGASDDADVSKKGMFLKMLGGGVSSNTSYFNDYYFVKNPAKIVFNLRVPSAGTAELTWNIVPFFYGAVKVSENSSNVDVVVAYKKDRISITDFTAKNIDSDILSAYNEII